MKFGVVAAVALTLSALSAPALAGSLSFRYEGTLGDTEDASISCFANAPTGANSAKRVHVFRADLSEAVCSALPATGEDAEARMDVDAVASVGNRRTGNESHACMLLDKRQSEANWWAEERDLATVGTALCVDAPRVRSDSSYDFSVTIQDQWGEGRDALVETITLAELRDACNTASPVLLFLHAQTESKCQMYTTQVTSATMVSFGAEPVLYASYLP